MTKIVTQEEMVRAIENGSIVDALENETYVSYGTFTMDEQKGLTKTVRSGRSNQAQFNDVWISKPFEILGECRDPNGSAWGKLLRFQDADGREHIKHVSNATLHGDPGVICQTLAHDGLNIARSEQRFLADYLASAKVSTRLTVVDRTGWHDIDGQRVFALPSSAIGNNAENVFLNLNAPSPYSSSGSLDDWKNSVATLAAGHVLMMFIVSAALAGPLLKLLDQEGGGIHLFGSSSIGKSAALQAAASVWGRGDTRGYVRSWRATANGLEGAAASATDTCLVLDELGVGGSRDVAAAVYALANGLGKARAQRDGSLREPRSWQVWIVSSGEISIEDKIADDRGGRAKAGQLIRVLDIPADRELGFGVFDSAGPFPDAGKLADAIKHAATSAYGTAGPEFVRRLLRHLDPAGRNLSTWRGKLQNFAAKLAGTDASEQVRRAAKKFALIAMAGELATALGITPWQNDDAKRAAEELFNAWIAKRGGKAPGEEQQAIAQVRRIIEQHGDSRFEEVDTRWPTSVSNRLGYRKGAGDTREWWVLPETWKAEFCSGLDPITVARALHKHGMLKRQNSTRFPRIVTLPGGTKKRVYVLTSKVLGEDAA